MFKKNIGNLLVTLGAVIIWLTSLPMPALRYGQACVCVHCPCLRGGNQLKWQWQWCLWQCQECCLDPVGVPTRGWWWQPRSSQTPGLKITGLWCGWEVGGWHAAMARTCGAQAACGHSWHVQGMSQQGMSRLACGAARGWGGLRCGGGGSVGPTFGQLGHCYTHHPHTTLHHIHGCAIFCYMLDLSDLA